MPSSLKLAGSSDLGARPIDHLVVRQVNVKMPKMKGIELRQRILAERPGIKVLLMSGFADTPLPGSAAFLPKPFGPSVLKDRIRAIGICPVAQNRSGFITVDNVTTQAENR